MSKEYCYSNWRDEFNPTEYEFVDLVKPDPIKTLDEGKKKGLWANIHAKRKRGERPAKPGEKGYPETLDIEEGLKKARKNVGASKCWDGYKAKGTKMKDGKEVPNCVKEAKHTPTKSDLEANIGGGNLKKLATKAAKRIDYDVDGDVDPQDKVEKSKGEYGEELPTPFGKFRTGGSKPAKVKKEEFSNWREDLDEGIMPAAINPKVHREAQRAKKIRTLSQKGTTEGERAAAERKTKGPKMFGEDWQKVNKGDKTDGMSQKAVDTYRRENPGSKLKTAVTGDPKPGSKDAKRRKSFCSRSKGQQDMHNIDCSKDPDKAICKARRRWKC